MYITVKRAYKDYPSTRVCLPRDLHCLERPLHFCLSLVCKRRGHIFKWLRYCVKHVVGEEPVPKEQRTDQTFWVQIKSATVENDDDKSDEGDDKLSSASLLVFPDEIPQHPIKKLYIGQAYIDICEMYIEKYDFIIF